MRIGYLSFLEKKSEMYYCFYSSVNLSSILGDVTNNSEWGEDDIYIIYYILIYC